MPETRVTVLFPMPLDRTYDYRAPAGMSVSAGDFVTAPFGPRDMRGVVWGEARDDVPAEKIKPLIGRFDAPPLAEDLRDFIDWVAQYTVFPRGAILRMVMRTGRALDAPAPRKVYAAAGVAPPRLTPARAAVLEAAKAAPAGAAELARAAGCTPGVVSGLAKAGALKAIEIVREREFPPPDLDRPGPALSPKQHAAARALKDKLAAGGFSATLIDGVTGSGKTEVYFEAIAEALARAAEAQALVLLPEIALTLQFVERVQARFGVAPALWHSDMTDADRRAVWRRACDGGARLVAGARSALFLPFRNLRLIVVDEEHDSSYKQEDGVLYQARDLAVARAARAGFPVILASATPSLETLANVEAGRYGKVTLPARFGGAVLPEIAAIDMRAEPLERGKWLSPKLVAGVAEALARGEQAMLFLNRRGYAPLTICRRCGHRMKAPHSDTWLVEHRFENRLVCHHTGFWMPKPKRCPACDAENSLAACGPGVERVADEAKALFPEARIKLFSSDTARSPAEAQAILSAMKAGEIDILIGTQVVAKGHHFPNLTLVGVIDADLGLNGGDLRAGERTYQVLIQVAGRAGRENKSGRVLLQTYQPEHPVMQALIAGDRDRFLGEEAAGRRDFGYPPFGRLGAVIVASENTQAANEAAQALAAAIPRARGVEVWGPAPAPLAKLRGRTRIRFLARAERDVNLSAYMRAWRGAVKIPASVRVAIDIDPYSFL